MDRLNYFKYYSLAKSTALTVAIFPLFLYNQLGLSEADIVHISSYCFLLPLLLEIPLGAFADYFGSVILIKLGLLIFTFAYISLLIFAKYEAYYLYILCITFAAACFSGAEDSLLIAILPNNYDLFAVKADLASFVYKATTILLLLGGGCYYFFPHSPIILQIISLIFSYLFLSKTTTGLVTPKMKNASTHFTSVLSCSGDIFSFYRLSLVLLIATSSFVVLLTNRTTSIHFTDVLDFNPAIIVSIIFVIGNLISSRANIWFKHYFNNYKTPIIPIAIIGSLAIAAFLFMSKPSFLWLSIGFLLLAIFKASYRAYLSAALVSSIINYNYIATILSASSVATAIISFGLSLLYAHFFINFHLANLYIASLLVIIFSLAVLSLYIQRREIRYVTHSHAFSGKKHFIKRYYQNFTYGQEYPDSAYINQNLKSNIYTTCLYPAPHLLNIADNIVEWEYIKGKRLSELAPAEQMNIINQLIVIFKKRLTNNITLAHGDLHPDNILIKNNGTYRVIDWDLCQTMPLDFDILSFLTHPELKINANTRLELIGEVLTISTVRAKETVQNFIQQKIVQLSNIKSEGLAKLIAKYKKLENDIAFAR